MIQKVMLAIIVLVSSTPVYADNNEASRASMLVNSCKEAVRLFDGGTGAELLAGHCMGHFSGMLSLHLYSNAVWGSSFICWPNGVTVEQMIRVYLKYMGNHPERLHNPTSFTVLDAAKDAFTC